MLRKTVDDYVMDILTEEQQAVCQQDGCFVVKACPGSGKTKTVGAWLATRVADWRTPHAGIAALSFTNTAWREIAAEAQAIGLPPIYWPHFVGTIDSFVNRYLVYPFGTAVMQCSRVPRVVLPDLLEFVSKYLAMPTECREKGCRPWRIRLDEGDNLHWEPGSSERYNPRCLGASCLRYKEKVWKLGYATPSDAMYIAMRVIKNRPEIADAVAQRFPKIIVDEAQDTTAVQMMILDELVSHGSDLALVGDPDQAIFEWNHADPGLLEEKAAHWTSCSLTANFRCSPAICAVTHPLSSLAAPSQSAGLSQWCPLPPLLVRYEASSPQDLSTLFNEILGENQISREASAILVRDHQMGRHISGGSSTANWPSPTKSSTGKRVSWLQKLLIFAAAARDAGQFGEALQAVTHALSFLCCDSPDDHARKSLVEDIGFRDWRVGAWQLMEALPDLSTPLSEWGPLTREALKCFFEDTDWPCVQRVGSWLRKCTLPGAEVPAVNFCSVIPEKTGTHAAIHVIHQVKARTFKAVLLVAGPGRHGISDCQQWFGETTDKEERRVGYVGMTRASHLLVLAVPEAEFDRVLASHGEQFTVHDL